MVKWWANGLFKADAEKVDTELRQIGETVSPASVLSYARENPDSELYKCFEWDDTIAAEKYRLTQARQVIQYLYEVPEGHTEPSVRRYSITSERGNYAPTRKFLINRDEYSALLERAMNELRAFQKKYRNLSELEEVFDAIDLLQSATK